MPDPKLRELAALLGAIGLLEAETPINYALRNDLVLAALTLARAAGLAAGVYIDPAAPDWPVVIIETPVGQVSWHLPAHPIPWDGHTTAEKYRRVDALLAAYPPHPPHAHGER